MSSFPQYDSVYSKLTVDQYLETLILMSRNKLILGENCCFSAIMNMQVNFGGRNDLTKAMIYPLRFNRENIEKWNNLFNENMESLGYYSLDELILDSGFERVEEPQKMDIAWCQTENDFTTLRPNQPFDKSYYNNGYIYNGEKWIKRMPYRFIEVTDPEEVVKITSHGIYRMVSS